MNHYVLANYTLFVVDQELTAAHNNKKWEVVEQSDCRVYYVYQVVVFLDGSRLMCRILMQLGVLKVRDTYFLPQKGKRFI